MKPFFQLGLKLPSDKESQQVMLSKLGDVLKKKFKKTMKDFSGSWDRASLMEIIG